MDETTIDRDTMEHLAKALAFICGADHPTTVALKAAAESDIKTARMLCSRLIVEPHSRCLRTDLEMVFCTAPAQRPEGVAHNGPVWRGQPEGPGHSGWHLSWKSVDSLRDSGAHFK
jgi:hypothetical protein